MYIEFIYVYVTSFYESLCMSDCPLIYIYWKGSKKTATCGRYFDPVALNNKYLVLIQSQLAQSQMYILCMALYLMLQY